MYTLVGVFATLLVVSSFAQVFTLEPHCASLAEQNEFENCCKLPLSVIANLDFTDLKYSSACKSEHTGLSDECLHQCSMKKSGTLDENNVLHKEFVAARLKSQLSSTDAWYQPLMDSWEHCVDLTNSKLEYLKEVHDKRQAGNCVPTVEFLTNCFTSFLFGKCPVSDRLGGEDCESLLLSYSHADFPQLKKYFKFHSNVNNYCDF